MTNTHPNPAHTPTIAIIGMGAMGSWVASQLIANGAEVTTVLSGRSAQSITRAKSANVRVVADDLELISQADFVFSIVPSTQVLPLAQRLAPALTAAKHKPIYVDCNAIAAQTMHQVEQIIRPTGCATVDAAIFGPVPKDGGGNPMFYLSGNDADKVAKLGAHGLNFKTLNAPVGSASSLKCIFAGLSKGAIALGAQAAMHAAKAGVTKDLVDVLPAYMPQLAAALAKSMPQAYTKSGRWITEMQQIGQDHQATPGGTTMFEGASAVYAALNAADAHRGTPENPMDIMETFVTELKAKL